MSDNRSSSLIIHFHFHRRRTGVTRSIENILPGLHQYAEVFLFGYGIEGPFISWRKLLRLIFSRTYFVIHAHRNNEIICALILRLLGGKFRLVATRHAESTPSGFTLFLLRKADKVVTLTKSMATNLPIASTVIGHGVDTSYFARNPTKNIADIAQKRIVSVIGRVRKEKGQKIFLEAVAPLLSKFSDVAALIVGKIDDDSFKEELQTIVNNYLVDEQVYFLHETKDVVRIYSSSEIVVVPSFSEGFSLVTLEAMACGCVVAATDGVGVNPELIKHGETGYLFNPGDVQQLQTLLEKILQDPASGQVIAENARTEAVAKWDVKREAEKLMELYTQ
jgi:mannosyltransferase